MGRYTGVTADLDTGRPGPTLALRFDMDCVDVGEDTSPDHRPAKEGFASVNSCRMHACGHDAHTAISLGVAELLAEHFGSMDALSAASELCRSEERRVGKECRSRWSPYH